MTVHSEPNAALIMVKVAYWNLAFGHCKAAFSLALYIYIYIYIYFGLSTSCTVASWHCIHVSVWPHHRILLSVLWDLHWKKPVKLQVKSNFEGCLTVHLPHGIKWNANLMRQCNVIDVFLARHVSGTYTHHRNISCWVPAYGFLHRVFWWVVILRAAA